MTKRNPIAKALRTPRFKKRTTPDKKKENARRAARVSSVRSVSSDDQSSS